MSRKYLPLLFVGVLALAGVAAYLGEEAPRSTPVRPAVPAPAPTPVVPDEPCPGPGPCPKPRPKPWGNDSEAAVGGPQHADGTEIQIDLPEAMHQKNTGGSDGAGLCVFASMRHSGLWADEPVFTGLFQWMRKHPGGGYPEKVDQMVARYCAEKGLAKPAYLQVQSADLEILKAACAAGLTPGVTYGFSPSGRYGGQKIAHMVTLVHADDRHFVVLDNNFPRTYEWLSPAEFRRAYTSTSGKGWAVIPLKAGPPPVPVPARIVSCAVPTAQPVRAPAPFVGPIEGAVRWEPWPGGEEAALLGPDGRQLGSWNAVRGYYRPILAGDEWGPPSLPPTPPPLADFGVDISRLDDVETYSVAGQRCDRARVLAAIEDATIPDLGSRLRVTVIGPAEQTAPVLGDLKASPHAGRIVAAAYLPTHWHVSQCGYRTDGRPTIYVQDAAGVVLHRQDDYADGAAGLGRVLDGLLGAAPAPAPPTPTASEAEKLRKRDPHYDPAKDRDRRKPLLPLGGESPLGLLILAGLGATLYHLSRRR